MAPRFACPLACSFVKRVKSTREEYAAFKDRWVKEELPAWLAAHGAGLDYYHSMEWLSQEERGRRKAWEQPLNGGTGSSTGEGGNSSGSGEWARGHGAPASSTYEGLFSDEEEQLAA